MEYYKAHGIFVVACAPPMRAQWDIPAILDVADKVCASYMRSYLDQALVLITVVDSTTSPWQVLVRWSLQRGCVLTPALSSSNDS